MSTLTLSIPNDLKKEMDELEYVNWSAIARRAIRDKIEQLKILKSISATSKLSEKDALEIGRKINRSLHERYKRDHPESYPV